MVKKTRRSVGNFSTRIVLIFICCIACIGKPSAQTGANSAFFSKYEFLVLFDVDRAELDTLSDTVMNALRKFLFLNKESGTIRLEGRTDHSGGSEYNMQLAKKRVRSVEDYLIKEGIPEDRFTESIYGKSNPLASNSTAEGRQRNRSVRITFGFYHPVDTVTGRILSDSTGQGIAATVFIQSRYHFDTVRTIADGRFEAVVPAEEIISVEAYGGGHYYSREYINLKGGKNIGTLKALPVRVGKVFHFDDILFVGDTNIVLKESMHLLPRLSHLIRESPEYRFEIQGHVNAPNQPVGPEGSWYHRLSEMRARKIYGYLLKSGIDSSRLEWNGYSNRHMLYPETSDPEEMQKNRRVSIKVLGRSFSAGEQ